MWKLARGVDDGIQFREIRSLHLPAHHILTEEVSLEIAHFKGFPVFKCGRSRFEIDLEATVEEVPCGIGEETAQVTYRYRPLLVLCFGKIGRYKGTGITALAEQPPRRGAGLLGIAEEPVSPLIVAGAPIPEICRVKCLKPMSGHHVSVDITAIRQGKSFIDIVEELAHQY